MITQRWYRGLEARQELNNAAWGILEQLPRKRNHSRLEEVGGNDITIEVKVTVFKTITIGPKLCQPKPIIYR